MDKGGPIPRWRVLLAWTAVGVLVGCNSTQVSSKEEYLARTQAIAREFDRYETTVLSAGLPDFKGKPRAEMLHILASSIRDNALKEDSLAREIEILHPPQGFEDHKRSFKHLFEGLAQRLRIWADAVESGNKSSEEEAGNAIDTFIPEALNQIIQVVKKHGADVADLKAMRDRLGKDIHGGG